MYVDQKGSAEEQVNHEEDLLREFERMFTGSSQEIRTKAARFLMTLDSNGKNGDGHSDEELVLSENARVILEQRYLRKDSEGNAIETPEELFRRVARAVAQGESNDLESLWENRFYKLLTSMRFLPNSPTLVNAGTGRGCLSACFVVTPDDNMESIMEVAHDAAMIEKWGGGIGFGLSKLRPRNDMIKTTHGNACGPIAVMKLYSAVGATLTQGAFRLGAHMGQIRDSHPDVREFIHCKDNDDTLQNFNISVQITDEFMRAVEADEEWALINPRDEGKGPVNSVVETISARELWNEIAESAWKTGDPGVVFIDRVWETAPNPQMGRIETSNPCGEEFLENYGNCCLGSINLDIHVKDWRTRLGNAGRHREDVGTVPGRRHQHQHFPIAETAKGQPGDAAHRTGGDGLGGRAGQNGSVIRLAGSAGHGGRAWRLHTADRVGRVGEADGRTRSVPGVRALRPQAARNAAGAKFQHSHDSPHRNHQQDSRLLQRDRASLRAGVVVERAVEGPRRHKFEACWTRPSSIIRSRSGRILAMTRERAASWSV